MSLPTTKPTPSQTSIRSFFRAPKAPERAISPFHTEIRDDTSANAASRTLSSPPRVPMQTQRSTAASITRAAPSANPKTLPPEATIRTITPEDIDALRRVNALLLPVNFPDALYYDATGEDAPFSRVITWAHDNQSPKVVGGIICKLEPALLEGIGKKQDDEGRLTQNLYIRSLCLLSPYRSFGLMNAAVDSIISTVNTDVDLDVRAITAHVWTENREGLHWYQNRGFQRRGSPIAGYYFKLRPDSAWLVMRQIGASVRASLPLTDTSGTITTQLRPPVRNNTAPSQFAQPQSFQNRGRSDMEWNDIPVDMAPGLLVPPRKAGNEAVSATSSRSSSVARKKRERVYPAAAYET